MTVNGLAQELNHPFTLDTFSGTLSAGRDLDFEESSTWVIEISAQDPSLNRATHFIYVTLNDINDNPPMFLGTPYRPLYAQEAQRLVLRPEAEDVDTGLGGLFEMAVEGFEQISDSQYTVNLTATDFGQPRLTGRVTFSLEIAAILVPCRFIGFELSHTNLTTTGELFVVSLCGFKEEPVDADFVLGGNHVFSCDAISNQDAGLSYQWIRNGSHVAGGTSAQLTITNIDFEDAGQYACRASVAGLGAIQTRPAVATVLGECGAPGDRVCWSVWVSVGEGTGSSRRCGGEE